MEEKVQKKKNWIELDSDEEEVEEKQEKVIETNNKQPQANDNAPQKESNNKDQQNVSSSNNEDVGYINEKRRGQMRDRENNGNNNHSRQSDQYARNNDRRNDDRRNNNNFNKEGKNDRRERFAQMHSQNCAEILKNIENQPEGETVWINCFQMGQSTAIDKDELLKAFFPAITFIQFESEKDKQDQFMADIKITVEDAKKISPDNPLMYKGFFFKIRYGAKNTQNNKDYQERRGGRQQNNRNDNERHTNNNEAREPAFNMKRNENNVGKVDQKVKSDVQGKKKDFFVEKHDRPQITNSKKKNEEESKKKTEDEQQLKPQKVGQIESEIAHDSHKGTGNTHYGEKDSLESDKIETQEQKPDQEGVANPSKESKEEKEHNQTGDKQQQKQPYQKNSERQQRDKRDKGFTKKVEGNQNESNPRGQRKEEQKNNKQSENKDKNNETEKNTNNNTNANNSNRGKKPNKQTVWVQKDKESEETEANDGFTVVKGSSKAVVDNSSKVQTATVVKSSINSRNIFSQR